MPNLPSDTSEPSNDWPQPQKTSETPPAQSKASPSTESLSTTENSKSLSPRTLIHGSLSSLEPTKPARVERSSSRRDALLEFEKFSGPREVIAKTISANSLSPEQEALVSLMLDPARMNDSLTSLAKDAGVGPDEILTLFRKGAIAAAHAIVTGQLAESLPAVTKAVIDGSVDRELPCKCIRVGLADSKCRICLGTGKQHKDADIERQKMIWQATGVLKQGGGVQISTQTNVGVAVNAGGGAMDRFVRATDAIAYDVSPGELVDDVKEPK